MNIPQQTCPDEFTVTRLRGETAARPAAARVGYRPGMSESGDQKQTDEPTEGISDQLPEDLQPSDDNPLAEGLSEEDDVDRDELDMLGGRGPDESDEDEGDGASGGDDTDD